jgi:small-conductance mechanosensitive channel
VARLAVWSLVLLLALDNLGFNITALLAGMGIGGIAVALAAQNILGDLFASLSIVLDKPFVVGDFIVVGEQLGTVEYIGLKTTRIRSLGGEQIVFSNTDLLGSRIRNYKRMQERRVVFGFGVVYQTPHEKLQTIPGMVREIIGKLDRARFDRAHFKEYGDSSLNFEVVYYVLSADYNVYMDIQQAINLELFRRFQEDGIDFAYPTRTLYVVGEQAARGGPGR